MECIKLMEGAAASKKKNSALDIDNNPDEHLMREFTYISNSQSAAAAVINQATEIRNELRSQGLSFGPITAGTGQIMNNVRVPIRSWKKSNARNLNMLKKTERKKEKTK
mmetsp:Transcript_11371/g.12206  ORF Transcript_11371/g.12206 Transcript_11371/m.12206 type:complete len:109 (+) Transcript_11371:315-641(+)